MKKILSVFLSLSLILTPVSGSFGQAEIPAEIDKGGYDFYFKQSLLLINSVIGASLLQSCYNALTKPSAAIWMGGGLAHIMLELLHKSDQEEKLMMKRKKLEEIGQNIKSQGTSADKAILQSQIDENKEFSEFIKVRRNWMIAIEAIYLTAAAFALVEYLREDGGTITCTSFNKKWIGPVLNLIWSAGTGLQEGGAISQSGTTAIGMVSLLTIFGEKARGLADKINDFLMKAIINPGGRAITFGAAALTGGAVTYGLHERYEMAESNTNKMNDALNNYIVEADGTGSGFDDGSTNLQTTSTNQPAAGKVTRFGEVKSLKKCFQVTEQSLVHSESACKNPLKLNTQNNLSGAFPTLNAVSGLTNQMANALASGDSAAASQLSDQIGSYAAKVKEIHKKLQAQVNNDLKKAGKKPLEFDKEIQKHLSEIGKGFSNPQSPQLATPSPLAPTSNGTKEVKSTETSAGIVAPVIELPQSSETLSTESPVEEAVAGQEPATLEQSLNDFEVPVEDISKESTVSIFQQVSNRYILNYTRIFEQKKSLPEDNSTALPKPSEPNQKIKE